MAKFFKGYIGDRLALWYAQNIQTGEKPGKHQHRWLFGDILRVCIKCGHTEGLGR